MAKAIKLVSQGDKIVTVGSLAKLTIDMLQNELKERKVTFEDGITKSALIELLIGNSSIVDKEPKKKIVTVEADKPLSEQDLVELGEKIKADSEKINSIISELKTPEELDIFLKEYTKNPALVDYMKETFFSNTNGIVPPVWLNGGLNATVASDMPASQIINNIPVRVVEQVIQNVSDFNYPMTDIIKKETVKNGLKQLFYKDYRDADSTSGFSNVTINDFNMGIEPIFSDVKQVDTNVHKGYDMLDSMLNDITINMGLFIALIQDSIMAIARPIAKRFYERFIDFLNTANSYDEILEFPKAMSVKEKAKEFYSHISSINTVSRSNLKKKPNGSTKSLEKAIKSEDIHLIINRKYQANYIYDLSANVFQIGEIRIPFKSVRIYDFEKLDEYKKDTTDTVLKDNELIFIEDGLYNEIIHYDGTKIVDTLKLKKVQHRYIRIGNYRTVDKYLGSYKTASA